MVSCILIDLELTKIIANLVDRITTGVSTSRQRLSYDYINYDECCVGEFSYIDARRHCAINYSGSSDFQ